MARQVILTVPFHKLGRPLPSDKPGPRLAPTVAAAAFLAGLLAAPALVASAAEAERAQLVMGTLLRVRTSGDQPDATAAAIFAEVERWDKRLSTYKPDSEISRLNARAPEPLTLSPPALDALRSALNWSRRTGGAFDVTIGPLVKAWGFDATPRLPSEQEIEAAKALVGYAKVNLAASGEASLERAGMALDFGGIGKGWALDRALDAAREGGNVDEVVLDFGGQFLFWSRHQKVWPAAVRHPRAEGEAALTLEVKKNGSLSTSAASERFLVAADPKAPMSAPKKYGHILDPRTGRPAELVESVTVWAPTAEEADALSTALFVLGPVAGLRFAEVEGAAAFILYSDPARGLASAASSQWKKEFGETKDK